MPLFVCRRATTTTARQRASTMRTTSNRLMGFRTRAAWSGTIETAALTCPPIQCRAEAVALARTGSRFPDAVRSWTTVASYRRAKWKVSCFIEQRWRKPFFGDFFLCTFYSTKEAPFYSTELSPGDWLRFFIPRIPWGLPVVRQGWWWCDYQRGARQCDAFAGSICTGRGVARDVAWDRCRR